MCFFKISRPDIALSSDFIVGFPGETDCDFQKTIDLIKDINFSNFITMEIIPPVTDPFACVRGGRAEEFKDQYTELSIKHLKQIEEQLN